MPVFNAVLTNQAENAALDYDNNQIALQITHVGFGTSTAVADLDQLSVLGEVGRVAVAGGGIEPNSRTLTANVIWTPDQVRDIGQIGFYAGDTLFCIYAPGVAIVRVTPDVGIAASFSVSLVRLPNGSVNIVVDNSLSPMMLLLGQHLTNPNPHPQYAMKAAFDSHVVQNGLEHGNILTLLNNLVSRFQGMLEFQYAVGCFYWTDRVGNPNTWLESIIGYETFWRPISGRSLMSIDPADSRIGTVGSVFGTMVTTLAIENLPPHDHADGDYNRLLLVNGGQTTDATDATGGEPNLGSAGTLQSVGASLPFNNVHPVYLSYCWQRYDPNTLNPLRTILISEDLLDLNLLDLFMSIYGTPVLGERVKFVIEEGVLVTASTTSNYAVVTGNWPTDSNLTMDVFGILAGRGGMGGNGGWLFEGNPDSSEGEDGGPCVLATYPISINNQNILAGGGAGGGGGKAYTSYIGGPGGGGVPYGLKGTSSWDPNYYDAAADAVYPEIVPTNAGRLSPGNGGISGNWLPATSTPYWDDELDQPVPYDDRFAGWGGNGGGFGQNGLRGRQGCQVGSCGLGKHGGLAGIAITGSVTVTGNPVLGR